MPRVTQALGGRLGGERLPALLEQLGQCHWGRVQRQAALQDLGVVFQTGLALCVLAGVAGVRLRRVRAALAQLLSDGVQGDIEQGAALGTVHGDSDKFVEAVVYFKPESRPRPGP